MTRAMLHSVLQTGATPIGVDFGASGARLLQLRRGRRGLELLAAARCDSDTSDPTDPKRLSGLTSAIAERLDAGGFRGRRAVLSLDDRLLRVKSMRLPALPDDETDQALRLDGAERLGFPAGEAEIGWIRAGSVRQGDDAREEIILVGALRRDVEACVDAAAAAGLTPIAVEPGFQACARAVGLRHRREVDQRHVRVVVDVGARLTGVIILRGDRVAFFKQLEWGGDALDLAASQRLGLEPDTIRGLRRQRRAGATPLDPRVDQVVFDAFRPLLDHLAHEVTLCVRYAMVTFRGDRPEAALVVGGEAEEPRLVEAIASAIGAPASAAEPLTGVDTSHATFAGADRRGSLSQWVTAMGLALRATHVSRHATPPRPTREKRRVAS